jgi:hypothetical protein
MNMRISRKMDAMRYPKGLGKDATKESFLSRKNRFIKPTYLLVNDGVSRLVLKSDAETRHLSEL